MTKPIELANELKELYFKRDINRGFRSVEVKKINFLAVYGSIDITSLLVTVDFIVPGEIETQQITALCYSTEGNTSCQSYVSMLSDYVSGNNENYKLIMTLSEASPENNNYFIESIIVMS
ncbi:hypothetical protein [uncultured Cedecea sp.]|uniref:hypothetical protein n=1 Tax=uncultured Cedecea sp. TaxID=988762 RepID=UPI00260F1A9F|nr:hypothetical protein [uncultured Cedecea sp.]